jgi:tRNA nucleotidyltransferase/poly(A) polymerase
LVGGCVRDSLIGKHTFDIDVNTPLKPDGIMDLFKNFSINTIGKDHGTVMIFLPHYKIEITTLRRDIETDGRNAIVAFTDNWEEDSNRRDFTINGLMMDVKTMTVYDYHRGIEDLMAGKVKFIGNYNQRVQEDYLRILRFIRFAIRFPHDFSLELQWLKPLVHGLKKVSIERIITEITLMIHHDQWQKAIKSLKFLGIDKLIGGNFNDNFDPLTMDDTQWDQRWAAVLLTLDNPIDSWPLNKSLKQILKSSSINVSIWNSQTLWKIFNNKNIHWPVLKIYNQRFKVLHSFLQQIQQFCEDRVVLNAYNEKKIPIINHENKHEIQPLLTNLLWELWQWWINSQEH